MAQGRFVIDDAVETAPAAKQPRFVIDEAPPKEEFSTLRNVGMGALKGASDIGSTLLRPLDAALELAGGKEIGSTHKERKKALGEFFGEQANPESLAFKGGELATDIAGTAGAGGVLAKGAQALGAAPKAVAALETGGFRLGPQAATTATGRVGDAALRVGAGAAGGATAAGLVNPEDATAGGVIGGVLPGAVRAAGKVGSALAPKGVNPTLEKTLNEAQGAGYVVPPSMAGAGVGSRILEGVSGKYKTNQLAGIRNQEVTDQLVRKSVGLPQGAPLTSDAMQQIRKDAFSKGYAPLTTLKGPITPAPSYTQELDKIAKQYSGPAKSFHGVAKADVDDLVNTFKSVNQFPADDAIGAIQILRDNAGDSFRAGNKALGKAQRGIADILEDQIEQSLTRSGAQGSGMLKSFRDARTLMAKAHTIEDAIREGGGHVDAKTIARGYQRAPKRLSGELATVGKFANNFGDVAGIPKSGNANPFTVLDAFTGGAGVAGATPLMALPAMRVASRYGILSKPYQERFVTGSVQQKRRLSELLEKPASRALAYQGGGD